MVYEQLKITFSYWNKCYIFDKCYTQVNVVLSCRYLFLFNNVLLVAVVSNLILFGKCVDIKLNSGFFLERIQDKNLFLLP